MEEVKKKKKKVNLTSKIFVIVMLAIPTINWLVFWLGVNYTSLVIAFQDLEGNFTFSHFEKFWADLTIGDAKLAVALKNTLIYFATSDFIVFPITICVSYFLYKKIAGYKIYRVIFYLPAIIVPFVLTYVFTKMIAANGPMGIMLDKMGAAIPDNGFLRTPTTATNTIVIYTMWVGVCAKMLLISGAMARIPIEVLESAKLDGVSVGGELIYMIVPLMWPTISTLVILSLTGLLNATGPIVLFTGGSISAYSLGTQTLSYWIFEKVSSVAGSEHNNYGDVAAMGICFTVVLVPIVFGTKWLVEKIPTVEY